MAAAKNGTVLAQGMLTLSRFVNVVSQPNPEILRHV